MQHSRDVHLTTFDGLYYNFQAAGEFILTQSTLLGNSFQIQIRLQPWGNSPAVTVMTQIAAAIGTDRVTFGINRSSFVMVDGNPVALSAAQPVLALSGGTLTRITAATYQLAWSTGEVATISNGGSFLNISVFGGPLDGPGSMRGLLGRDSGPANDFALPNGTVLQQPLTPAVLYGQYANAWRITQAQALLDYNTGQTTVTFGPAITR